MASNVGDMDVFFRSMSARGSLGGLSTATTDAVKALDAFGKDKVIIETVGAGQNEIDIVKMADTVAVLVPPDSGDDVQMLKAGILEIADLFVVNKADLDGANRTVQELKEMIEYRDGGMPSRVGHHGASAGGFDRPGADDDSDDSDDSDDGEGWAPPIVEAVATDSKGVDDVLDALVDHRAYLSESGERESQARMRYAEEIRTLLREDTSALLEAEVQRRGGLDQYAERVRNRKTDPYTVSDELLKPLADCLDDDRK